MGLAHDTRDADDEEGDERVEDEAGDRERAQPLVGGLESDREEAEQEHERTDECQDYGHCGSPMLVMGCDASIPIHVNHVLHDYPFFFPLWGPTNLVIREILLPTEKGK